MPQRKTNQNIAEEDANDADIVESSTVMDGATESTGDAIKSTLDPISSKPSPDISC